MIITLGFAEPHDSGADRSNRDGRRTGGGQYLVTIDVDYAGPSLPAQLWAECVFTALNDNWPCVNPIVAAIHRALAEQVHVPLRGLSVGDTVAADGQVWVCVPAAAGWQRIHQSITASS